MKAKTVLAVALALPFMAVRPMSAQTADQCAAALTETGRNELLQINDVDIRSYYYKKLCESDMSSLSINASSVERELLYQASTLLGISYTNRKQYCEEEQKYASTHTFSYLRTSIVVEKTLDNWLECVRITSKGIRVTPTIHPERMVLAIERAGLTSGVVSGVSATEGITCEAWVTTGTGTQAKLRKIDLSKNSYVLSNIDALSVICNRASKDSTAVAGGKVYPEGLVTVITSQGPFTFKLPEEPRGPETWAHDIDARIGALETSTAGSLTALQGKVSNLGPVALTNCSPEPFKPLRADDHVECSGGKVAQGIGFGSKAGEWRLWCCTLNLIQ